MVAQIIVSYCQTYMVKTLFPMNHCQKILQKRFAFFLIQWHHADSAAVDCVASAAEERTVRYIRGAVGHVSSTALLGGISADRVPDTGGALHHEEMNIKLRRLPDNWIWICDVLTCTKELPKHCVRTHIERRVFCRI